jgi:predicted  nucleic acid-binding Zn-ribbon protein
MDRMEYLKERQESLEGNITRTSNSLGNIAGKIPKQIAKYRSSTRDAIIKLAIELHDLKTELQDVSNEIKRRENISKVV